MKHPLRIALFALLTVLPSIRSTAQAVQDLTTKTTDSKCAAILEVLRAGVMKAVGQDVKFVVSWMKVSQGFAFFRGNTRSATGGQLPWERIPAYRDMVADGLFDGDGTSALLKLTGGKWMLVTYVIGPTDVAWACWWKEYRAPRAIFDLAEDCQ